MSQCPDDVVRFYTSFRVGNHRSRTFAGTLCTIKLSINGVETGISVNGVEFLLGHTTFFSLVVDVLIHFLSTDATGVVAAVIDRISKSMRQLSLASFFHPFHFQVTHGNQSIVYCIHQFHANDRLTTYSCCRSTFDSVNLGRHDTVFVRIQLGKFLLVCLVGVTIYATQCVIRSSRDVETECQTIILVVCQICMVSVVSFSIFSVCNTNLHQFLQIKRLVIRLLKVYIFVGFRFVYAYRVMIVYIEVFFAVVLDFIGKLTGHSFAKVSFAINQIRNLNLFVQTYIFRVHIHLSTLFVKSFLFSSCIVFSSDRSFQRCHVELFLVAGSRCSDRTLDCLFEFYCQHVLIDVVLNRLNRAVSLNISTGSLGHNIFRCDAIK